MPYNASGQELLVLFLSIVVVLFDGLAHGGATTQLKDFYVFQLSDGVRVGLWASCKFQGNSCEQIANVADNSPVGTLHSLLIARYFLLAGAILFAFIAIGAFAYCLSSGRHIKSDESFHRVFLPVSTISLMLHVAGALVVSTLIRLLKKGTVAGATVRQPDVNLAEIFLWVAVGAILLTMLTVLRFGGILCRNVKLDRFEE